MTQPSPDTLEREKDKLYLTDAEIIRRVGAPTRTMRAALRAFDDNPASGFPRKQKLFGDRRYWPAVRDYLDRINGLKMPDRRG